MAIKNTKAKENRTEQYHQLDLTDIKGTLAPPLTEYKKFFSSTRGTLSRRTICWTIKQAKSFKGLKS